MKISGSERVIGLILVLMNSPHALSKEEIFELLPGYKDATQSRSALERMFARDKELLRKLGCALVVNEVDGDFKYQINATANSNCIAVTDWERSLISSIACIWADDEIGSTIEDAVKKLLPVSSSAEHTSPQAVEPLAGVFAKLKVIGKHSKQIVQAISEKKALSIEYLDKTAQIYPLQLVYPNNNWYLLAFDIAQEKLKTYKIERIRKIIKLYDYDYQLDEEVDELHVFSDNYQRPELSREEKERAVLSLKVEVVEQLGAESAR